MFNIKLYAYSEKRIKHNNRGNISIATFWKIVSYFLYTFQNSEINLHSFLKRRKGILPVQILWNSYLHLLIPTLQSGEGAVLPCPWIERNEAVDRLTGCEDRGRRQAFECCCFAIRIHFYFLVSFQDRPANSVTEKLTSRLDAARCYGNEARLGSKALFSLAWEIPISINESALVCEATGLPVSTDMRMT